MGQGLATAAQDKPHTNLVFKLWTQTAPEHTTHNLFHSAVYMHFTPAYKPNVQAMAPKCSRTPQNAPRYQTQSLRPLNYSKTTNLWVLWIVDADGEKGAGALPESRTNLAQNVLMHLKDLYIAFYSIRGFR